MARAVRIKYGGTFCHMMARGNRREQIFRSDHDRKLFLVQSGYRPCDLRANSSATRMAGRTARDEERSQRESATASQLGKCQAIGPPALPPEVAFIYQELMPDPSFRWL